MTSNTPYTSRQPHIKPAPRGFSPGLQDLFTPDIFFYLTTWTFNLEKLLRQGRGFGGAALFSLISLKKAISGQMFLPPLFLFLTGSCKAVLGWDWEQDATCVGSSRAQALVPGNIWTNPVRYKKCSVCWYRCTGHIAVGELGPDVSCWNGTAGQDNHG